MPLKNICSNCQNCLIKLQQCQCTDEIFEAVESFSSIVACKESSKSCRKHYPCCHLIKWICPCCCQNKIPLHCRICWKVCRGEIEGEIQFNNTTHHSVAQVVPHEAVFPNFDW